jgi:membrane protein
MLLGPCSMAGHIRTRRHFGSVRPLHLPSLAGYRSALARTGAWLKDLLACLERSRTLGLAAETAFWLFLSLLPLAAVAGLLAARFSVNNWSDVAPLLSSLPSATRQLVGTELMRVAAWNEGTVGAGSAAMFVWLASSGLHSIFDSLEIETGTSRPWWKKRLLAIGTCVALSVAVALLAVLGPGLEGALGWLGRWIPLFRVAEEPTTMSRVVRFGVSTAIIFSYIAALYWVGVPPRARRRMPIVPGAALAVVLQILLGLAYALYVSKVGDGGAYVAGLATIGVTMIGLYLFSAALLTGAVLNRKLGKDRESCPGPRPPQRETRS